MTDYKERHPANFIQRAALNMIIGKALDGKLKEPLAKCWFPEELNPILDWFAEEMFNEGVRHAHNHINMALWQIPQKQLTPFYEWQEKQKNE